MSKNTSLIAMRLIHISYLISILVSCSPSQEKLPIYGYREAIKKVIDGKTVIDTLYNTIPAFKFVSQNGDTVTLKNTENKIYVADFFFTSCPTICPVMKKNMLEVYKKIKGQNDILILSHSIDPQHDTPAVLKEYAKDLGVSGSQWLFLTGKREEIYKIGEKHYLVPTSEDSTVAGGYIHSGAFLLVDKQKRVRGSYDGTTKEGTEKLLADIERLRAEYQ